jgi:hypothetical protein
MKTFPRGARRIIFFAVLFLAAATIALPARAQNQELTFSLGGIPGQTRSFQGSAGTAQISEDRSLELTTAIVSWERRSRLCMAKLNL